METECCAEGLVVAAVADDLVAGPREDVVLLEREEDPVADLACFVGQKECALKECFADIQRMIGVVDGRRETERHIQLADCQCAEIGRLEADCPSMETGRLEADLAGAAKLPVVHSRLVARIRPPGYGPGLDLRTLGDHADIPVLEAEPRLRNWVVLVEEVVESVEGMAGRDQKDN